MEAATQALRDAERAVEGYLAEAAPAHRETIRAAIAKDRTAAMKAVEDATERVDALLGDLAALMQVQPIPTAGRMTALPSRDRRHLGQEYAQHEVRTLLRDLRAVLEGMVPPSEEAFTDAVNGTPGYLHRVPEDRDRWAGFVTSQVQPGQAVNVIGRLS